MNTLTFGQRQDIASYYQRHHAEIMRAGRGFGIDKYCIPHLDCRTPIEQMAFDAAISEGVAMYPEFPVGRFFLDLGNPRLKIGVELDGLQFHLDWAADSKRDAELWSVHGWKIFRCTGSRCNVIYRRPEETDVKGMQEWMHDTIDGLMYAIRVVYIDKFDSLRDEAKLELSRSRIIDDFEI